MTPKGVYPRAIWRPVPRALYAAPITPTAAILHSNAGSSGDLYGWWTNPAARGLYSHFQVTLDGTVYQYGSIYRRAPANVAANAYAVSIETANNPGHGTFPGFDTDVWSGAQRAAIIDLLDWLAAEAGIERAACVDGRHGIGGHDWYDAWRTTGHVCPGARRNAQIRSDIIPAVAGRLSPEVPDMTPEQERRQQRIAQYARTAAEQASSSALSAAGAYRLAEIGLSWAAHGGIREGIALIYRSRLGRDPDAAGLAAWSQAARRLTYEQVDARVADSDEARGR